MLSAIVRKEFLAQVLTLRFAIGTVFCIILFTTSALVLRADYHDRVEAHRAASARHRDSIASATTFSGVYIEVDRPPAPLSLFCRGEDRAQHVQVVGVGQVAKGAVVGDQVALFGGKAGKLAARVRLQLF